MFENDSVDKTIDIELAAKALGGKVEMAKRMIGILMNELPEYKQTFEEAHQNKDYESLARFAHKLYGSSCYCGVPRLQPAVKELELAAKNKEIEKIQELVERVCDEIYAIIQAYQNVLD